MKKKNDSKLQFINGKKVENLKPGTKHKKESLLIKDESYESIFLAKLEGTNDDYFQKLGINWISDTKIEYALVYNNQLCEGYCKGKAMRKDAEILVEINKHDRKYEFSFISFEDQKENFTVRIKMEPIDKKELEVEFISAKNNIDCQPYETVMFALK